MQRTMTGISWLAVAAAGLLVSGCATQEYVDEQIAAVNGRIESVNGQVGQLASRVDTNAASAQKAQARADEAMTLAQGKLSRTVVSENDGVNFATNEWQLSSEAQATLTAFADRLKADNKNVFVEIVGRGDPRGSTYNNRVLGEKRALEVRRFLSAQGIPLNHMETVSWGEEKPIAVDAADTGGDAHAAQRRVILRVTS